MYFISELLLKVSFQPFRNLFPYTWETTLNNLHHYGRQITFS
nr:MAG TPA: hypothetical protein [Caudoviricetes sp.]